MDIGSRGALSRTSAAPALIVSAAAVAPAAPRICLREIGRMKEHGLWRPCHVRKLTACDRGDDADLVAFLHRRIEILQEADVFIVEVDVDETIELVFAF